MRQFCQLYGQLDRDAGTLARIATLASHFEAADPADAAWALHLLLGKQRRRLITARRLRLLALRVTGLPDWLLEASHAQVGDTAETIALLLAGSGPARGRDGGSGEGRGEGRAGASAADPAPAALAGSLQHWMEQEIPRLAGLEEHAQAAALEAHWRHLGCDEVLVLNKLLTGAFRVGVGPGLVVKALARFSGREESLLQHRLMGGFSPSAEAFAALLAPPESGTVPPSRPYPFLLACPLEPERLPPWDPQGWLAEWKWDGIRAQLIRRGDETFLWSRGEELINGSFPDLLGAAHPLPAGTVLDGELLVWPAAAAHPQPFAALQKRLGQRRPSARLLSEAPVTYVVYDLLEADGVDQRQQPLALRRQRLESLLADLRSAWIRPSSLLPLGGWHDLERWRREARAVGAEGVMLKALDSPYASGRRRGLWWKHKLDPFHLDAVLLYARNGSGRRANLYTDYTFGLWSDAEALGAADAEPAAGPAGAIGSGRKLVSFASAYSGLSDAELVELDRWIRRHTSERFGPVRAVQPELVFELAFEGVQRSSRHKSGIAVRFPRIARWRRDKPAAEADTLASALALIPP